MKKFDKNFLEKMAKEKNIDKSKIEKFAKKYKDKSEDELISELIKAGKGLEGKEEIASKFKTFLNSDQQSKLDDIMKKISNSESGTKNKKKLKRRKIISTKKYNSKI